jgi:hypothetical protein
MDLWIAFTRLLDRDWFRRIWVIQEIILSRLASVSCGSHRLRWDVIVDACKVVMKHNMYEWDYMRLRCGNVLNIERRRQGYMEARRQVRETGEVSLSTMPEFVQEMNLGMLQIWTRHCGATDPRDKVLA